MVECFLFTNTGPKSMWYFLISLFLYSKLMLTALKIQYVNTGLHLPLLHKYFYPTKNMFYLLLIFVNRQKHHSEWINITVKKAFSYFYMQNFCLCCSYFPPPFFLSSGPWGMCCWYSSWEVFMSGCTNSQYFPLKTFQTMSQISRSLALYTGSTT